MPPCPPGSFSVNNVLRNHNSGAMAPHAFGQRIRRPRRPPCGQVGTACDKLKEAGPRFAGRIGDEDRYVEPRRCLREQSQMHAAHVHRAASRCQPLTAQWPSSVSRTGRLPAPAGMRGKFRQNGGGKYCGAFLRWPAMHWMQYLACSANRGCRSTPARSADSVVALQHVFAEVILNCTSWLAGPG